MKQAELARAIGTTPIWFSAVKCGRDDAGKNLAAKVAVMIGGSAELWMLRKNRSKRAKVVNDYLARINQKVKKKNRSKRAKVVNDYLARINQKVKK